MQTCADGFPRVTGVAVVLGLWVSLGVLTGGAGSATTSVPFATKASNVTLKLLSAREAARR